MLLMTWGDIHTCSDAEQVGAEVVNEKEQIQLLIKSTSDLINHFPFFCYHIIVQVDGQCVWRLVGVVVFF